MPISNKIRYLYQLANFKMRKHVEHPMKEALTKLTIPYSKYKGAKVIIIHDIDNIGFEEEMHEMIDLERKKKIKSIIMVLRKTMYYAKIFNVDVGMHETFPYRFKKNMKIFDNLGVGVKSYSQHVAIKRTNFYPMILNKLPDKIQYMFVDPVSFGYKTNHVMFYWPKKYKHITMISIVSEPSKKDIDMVLKEAAKMKGIIAFNFHPDHFKKGDKYFSKNRENFEYLLKKLR
ncbi:MAG: hypothetical protein KJ697_04990 [Nanoarchaeota archaeon]|nr:hypothetical protein [Nanoarchaeota archaeon]MBU4038025.1 hypothetical protein [Pseudomonadota bacterium]MBU4124295.1 hypothetical protein [Nanoarchaeota archaeon]